MHILLRGDLLQRLRIASGLILFTFAATHFLNTAVGLVDLQTMHEVQAWRQLVTRSLPGTFVLLLALVTHITLALYKLANRSTLRLPAWELFQIGLGLLIPFLLFPHIVNTRIAHVFFGVEDNYLYELARLWPENAILQSTLLLLVWVHGCLGLHFWLRLYTPYRAAAPVLLFVAIAVPLAALGGFMVSGRAVALSIENPQMLAKVKELTNWPNATDGAILAWYRHLGAARLCRRPADDRPHHGLALLRAEHAAEDRHQVHGRADREGAARADPARDQPHAQHPARLGVRRARALLDLPGAHRRGLGLAEPARLPGSHHARQHRRAAERAPCLPGAARAARSPSRACCGRPAPVRRPPTCWSSTPPAWRSRWP